MVLFSPQQHKTACCKTHLLNAKGFEMGNLPGIMVFSRLGFFLFLFVPVSSEQFRSQKIESVQSVENYVSLLPKNKKKTNLENDERQVLKHWRLCS